MTSCDDTTPAFAGRYGPNYQRLRLLALERDDHRCCACYSAEDLEVHHRTPDGHPAGFDDRYLKLKHIYTFCVRCHDLWTDAARRGRFSRRDIPIPETPNPDTGQRPAITARAIVPVAETVHNENGRPKILQRAPIQVPETEIQLKPKPFKGNLK